MSASSLCVSRRSVILTGSIRDLCFLLYSGLKLYAHFIYLLHPFSYLTDHIQITYNQAERNTVPDYKGYICLACLFRRFRCRHRLEMNG